LIEDFRVWIKTQKSDMCMANAMPEDRATKLFISPRSTQLDYSKW
jgi:hypothetical protein